MEEVQEEKLVGYSQVNSRAQTPRDDQSTKSKRPKTATTGRTATTNFTLQFHGGLGSQETARVLSGETTDRLTDIMKPDWYKQRPQTGRGDQTTRVTINSGRAMSPVPADHTLKTSMKSSREPTGPPRPATFRGNQNEKKVNINLDLKRPPPLK